MLRPKRLVLLAAVAAASIAGWHFGFVVTGACIGLMAGLLAGLRGIQYALAHAGVKRLAREAQRYRLSTLAANLDARRHGDGSFTFVVLGDNRNTTRIPPQIYRKAKEEGPAFIFNTGDLARLGTAHEYRTRYLPLLEIADPIPVFSVPGNHDRGVRNDFAGYLALCGEERFSFDYGGCRFVGVNNAKRARMEADDLKYLHRELSRPPDGGAPIRHKFVFIHIPPRDFEDGVVTAKKRRGFKKLRKEFHALMRAHNVAEVFMGHIHGYAVKEVDGVRYTLTAGAGARLCRELPIKLRVHHYVVVHAMPDGLTREVVRYLDGAWVRGV